LGGGAGELVRWRHIEPANTFALYPVPPRLQERRAMSLRLRLPIPRNEAGVPRGGIRGAVSPAR